MASPGEHIGHYELQGEIGRGGMGIVYLARDSRLGRQVAIKALPEHLLDDAARLERFRREARTLASLNHSNIAQIYGVEELEGISYLVLEYIDGQTLAERLDRGPLTIEESLEICIEVARAMESAHDAGVVHRDLKPENIRISESGVAKVLDFGLARVEDRSGSSTAVTDAATLSLTAERRNPTNPGMVLGTAAYMSPEQARGRSVDRRTDIWSFGVLLYECLTGRNPFLGETTTDSIGAVLHKSPEFDQLPAAVPPIVRHVIQRCLERDKEKRLRDIGDARIELEAALSGGLIAAAPDTNVPLAKSRIVGLMIGTGLGALATVLIAAVLFLMGLISLSAGSVERMTQRFTIELPEGISLARRSMNGFDVSPDGQSVAAIVEDSEGSTRLLVRRFSSFEPMMFEQLREPRGPSFSPDGKWIAFLDQFKEIRRVSTSGGPSQRIGEIESISSVAIGELAWRGQDALSYSEFADDIYEVAINSGQRRVIGSAKSDERVFGVDTSQMLTPDGRFLLVSTWSGRKRSDNEVSLFDLTSGTFKKLLRDASDPSFVADRWLVFIRDGSLYATEFDFTKLEPTGDTRVVIEGVATSSWSTDGEYSVSDSGTLVFVPGTRRAVGRRIIRKSRDGVSEPVGATTEPINRGPWLSPDGVRVAYTTIDDAIDIWVLDLETGVKSRFTGGEVVYSTLFSQDGRTLYCWGDEESQPYLRSIDLVSGRIADIEIYEKGVYLTSWDAHGRVMATYEQLDRNIFSIGRLVPGEWSLEPYLVSPDSVWGAQVSPDGQWMVYQAYRAGYEEILIRVYPDGERDWLIKTGNFDHVQWSPDGTEILFLTDEAVPVQYAISFDIESTTGEPIFGEPERLFELAGGDTIASASPDGFFYTMDLAEWEKRPGRLHVVTNWDKELAQLFGDVSGK